MINICTLYIDDLVQDCSNSSALAMEQCQRLRQVRRSETGNFWSGPGAYYTFLYKLMFEFLKILIRAGNFFSLVLNTAMELLQLSTKPSIYLITMLAT